MRASHWLAVTFVVLPIPADAAVARAEQLLQEASGDLWAEADLLKPLCVLYAHIGRAADAREALTRSQSIFTGFGAKLALAESAIAAGDVEQILGDPAAAEHYLREGYEALRAMGDRGYLGVIAATIAEMLYAQGRFDEAQQMLEEARAASAPGHETGLIQAKLLARRGQFAAARQLADEAEAQISPTSSPADQAFVLETRAEVDRLAGAPSHAAASLRAALRIYEDMRAIYLAERARADLAILTAQADPEPM